MSTGTALLNVTSEQWNDLSEENQRKMLLSIVTACDKDGVTSVTIFGSDKKQIAAFDKVTQKPEAKPTPVLHTDN